MRIDSLADVAEISPRFCRFQPLEHTFLGNFDQALRIVRHIADHKHAGRIRKVSVQDGGYIDIDNVAVL